MEDFTDLRLKKIQKRFKKQKQIILKLIRIIHII
jgi:hypothetical protein